MTTLLSVDWDYFFPNPFDGAGSKYVPESHTLLYDWNHRESPLYIEALWPNRAAAFLSRNLPLPSLHPSHLSFWNRFTFTRSCRLYYAESHAMASHRRVRHGITRVLSFDAHHDCGYGSDSTIRAMNGIATCENWTYWYHSRIARAGNQIEVHYPPWRTKPERGGEFPFARIRDSKRTFHDTPISRVFVCRSGAWVPPWHDESFEEFIRKPNLPLTDIGSYSRSFNLDDVEDIRRRIASVS